MDAKPQRPRLRVFGDENAIPTAYQPKSLHSRHKSQPALKAGIATAGPQKFGGRKAFGEVSNVAVNRLLRDDSVIKGKTSWDKDKLAIKEVDLKPTSVETAVSRSAELSVAGTTLKNTAPEGIETKATVSARPLLPEITRPPPVKAVRKSKTTVFHEKPAPEPRQKIQQDLELPRARLPRPDVIAQTTDDSRYHAVNNQLEDMVELMEPDEGVAIHFLDDKLAEENESSPSEISIIDEAPQASVLPVDVDSYESASEFILESDALGEHSVEDILIQHLAPAPTHLDVLEKQPNTVISVPEPEEYWDEEEDDGYAEDGYVTARSFKSLGESVTGNATHTLYPRVDQAVKRELAAAKTLIESTIDPEQVEDEKWDTSMVAEYGDEIFAYMREMEVRMSPNPHYMDKQTEIQWSMRAVLMDWIVQVHHRFGLLPETLFLCVNLIDRFLSQKVVSLTKLQLVGATAIFVAAKYEEVDCPSIQEVQFMVDNGYKVEEILKAERFMLSMLGFELGFPGPMSFLRRISKADDYDLETRTLAKYFLEITIMDERFLTCVPSFTAAGAHCLARMMLHKGNWSPAHVYYSEYTYSQLYPLISLILECCEDPMTHHAAIYDKYLDKRYKKAAQYVQSELQRGFRVPEENINVQPQIYATHSYGVPIEHCNWDAPWFRA